MRMLGKASVRRAYVAVGARARRCSCKDCKIERTHGEQRAREKRAWRREVEA